MMSRFCLALSILICSLISQATPRTLAIDESSVGPADSVYLFAYSRDNGKSGLLLAWSIDQKNWNGIGPHHRFLFSDFGRWGSQKRMFDPFLFQDANGTWHCVWTLNDGIQQFAHAASENLFEWGRQVYPTLMEEGNVNKLEVSRAGDQYMVSWESEAGTFQSKTSDFKNYSDTKAYSSDARLDKRVKARIDGEDYEGMVNRVSWELVENLIKHYEWTQFHEQERRETISDDPTRFADLEPIDLNVKLEPENTKEISEMLMGIFFEDISYAADGGLYGELIQNRDFEYKPEDWRGQNKEWNAWYAWTYEEDNYGFEIDSVGPIHPNNPYYAIIDGKPKGKGLINEGWDGIPVTKGEKYDFSVFSKSLGNENKAVVVRLIDKDGKGIGETTIKKIGKNWKKYGAVITAKESVVDARLEILPQQDGKLALDMISLFPQKTFKRRKNGLRPDLAQVIADLNPKFVRFPGGCVAHGDGLDNIYRWKNSIGPLEARVPMRNIWGYHQTLGLGYYEYFQFCEDIGAAPLPVLAAGVPCQNSSTGGHGQCGGIPMDQMDEYVQDILDLIEWANGDKNTEWGRKRAEAGHPKPFNLKYVGIGNEDLITDIFEERFTMIYNAIQEKYPEIVVIGTVGPFYMGTDYDQGWDLAKKLDVPMVDEHYYVPPGWMLNNQDFYDKYPRTGPKVYLGEYAAHTHGRRMNIETALNEAIYLINVERNADVVEMTSFAPLLAKERYTNWTPDLIYFNNTEVKLTVDYYVQKLFGQNAGDQYIPKRMTFSNKSKDVTKRVDVSVVKDSGSGDVIVKIANLLPVKVNADIDLSQVGIQPQTTTLNIVSGQPRDEGVKPVQESVEITSKFKYQLKPYSFTVFRVKGE